MVKNFSIKFVFILCLLWWAYLFFATQIVIVFDAQGYEDLGKTIAYQGWPQFFKTGPQREPLFPLLIAISMHLGDMLKVSYFYPLKIFGICFLGLTLVLSQRLMHMMSIRTPVIACALLYLGLSPVMTNSSMRLWSEFAAYPWVLLAVIWSVKSWTLLKGSPEGKNIIGHGLMLALSFILLMSVKAPAEGMLLFFLWPFYLKIIRGLSRRNFINTQRAVVFCATVLIVFEAFACGYRGLNYAYNGNFAFTNRGDIAFYGNTARRMAPLTPKRLGAAIAFVPGLDVCSKHFAQEDCDYWSARHSDDIMDAKQADLNARGLGVKAASRYYVGSSIRMVLANPLQALLMMAIEGQKLFFWESSIAFVAYPNWMENILYAPAFIKFMKFLMALLSFAACAFGLMSLAVSRRPSQERDTVFWTLNFIAGFMIMYSLFFILDRYSYPLIALYLSLMAFALDKILPRTNGLFPKLPDAVKISAIGLVLLLGGYLMARAGITKAQHVADEKAKVMTISYYFPDFSYFSDIVMNKSQPHSDLMDGYHFGKPYIFRMYYQKTVDLFPQKDDAQFLLAYCDYYQNDPDAALGHFQKSLQANPYFFWANYDLGLMYFQRQDMMKSAVLFDRALSLKKEIVLQIIMQSPFYRQIWRGIDNPPLVLENNFDQAQQDAALMLAACILDAGGYAQAVHLWSMYGQGASSHQDLWGQVYQKAVNKQRLDAGLYQKLVAQIPVRLF